MISSLPHHFRALYVSSKQRSLIFLTAEHGLESPRCKVLTVHFVPAMKPWNSKTAAGSCPEFAGCSQKQSHRALTQPKPRSSSSCSCISAYTSCALDTADPGFSLHRGQFHCLIAIWVWSEIPHIPNICTKDLYVLFGNPLCFVYIVRSRK